QTDEPRGSSFEGTRDTLTVPTASRAHGTSWIVDGAIATAPRVARWRKIEDVITVPYPAVGCRAGITGT
ncbi:hypothetical protein, partial [Methanoculleus sp. UBA312]|uniref:hypothetical protein n=1 Tax=Methanoculleus sp. UBA312 TaxID=1915499 RepID=UPI0031BA5A1B